MNKRPVKPFDDECRDTISSLRASIVELCDDLGADPEAPQEVSRQLGVNKTLTWSVSRVVRAANHLEALPHIPGTAAIEQFLKAAENRGADVSRIEKVRAAAGELQRLVREHFDDRGTLDLMLDGLGDQGTESLQNSRKLAYRGNSGVFGVQAKVRMMCGLLAPNPNNPATLDMIILSGYVGFRRLREKVRWPLFKLRSWGGPQDRIQDLSGYVPLDQSRGLNRAALLWKYSSSNMPAVDEESTDGGRDFVLGEGPVGNAGAVDCFRGEILRATATRYAEKPGDTGELGINLTTPAEGLVMDLIYHRDLPFVGKAELAVFGRILSQGKSYYDFPDGGSKLPLYATPQELGGRPPVVSTPMVPRYTEMVRDAADAMDWKLEDFAGLRVTLEFPPLWSSLHLRFPLPSRT
jgi:hypothetical protein